MAESGVEEERAELGVAGVIVGQEQGRRRMVEVELARGVDLGADVIVVPGLGKPDRGFDGADSDHAAVFPVGQYEHEALIGLVGLAGERTERTRNACLKAVGVGRQGREPRAGSLG